MNKITIMGLLTSITLIGCPIHAQYQSKGGYVTTPQIVNHKEYYKRHRFVATDFDAWIALLGRAQAYETFDTLVETGKLSHHAIAREPIFINGRRFAPGVGITVSDINAVLVPTYNALAELKSIQVLDADGYLMGLTQNITTQFENYDFSYLVSKLSPLPLPITNSATRQELLTQLYQLIAYNHKVLETTVVDTTRYESRNDNIFNALIENMLGNFLGSIFTPDKTQINSQGLRYRPYVDIDALYPIPIGFSTYPYEDQRSGLYLFNGNPGSTTVAVSGAQFDDSSQYKVGAVMRSLIPTTLRPNGAIGYTAIGLDYELYKEIGNRHAFTLSFNGGQSLPSMTLEGGVGLTYFRLPEVSGLGLGLNTAFNWYFWSPVSLSTEASIAWNPNITTNGDLSLGLNLHLTNAVLGVGYKFYSYGTENQTISTNGLFGSMRVFF